MQVLNLEYLSGLEICIWKASSTMGLNKKNLGESMMRKRKVIKFPGAPDNKLGQSRGESKEPGQK